MAGAATAGFYYCELDGALHLLGPSRWAHSCSSRCQRILIAPSTSTTLLLTLTSIHLIQVSRRR